MSVYDSGLINAFSVLQQRVLGSCATSEDCVCLFVGDLYVCVSVYVCICVLVSITPLEARGFGSLPMPPNTAPEI